MSASPMPWIVDRRKVSDLEGFHPKALQEEALFTLSLVIFSRRINIPSGGTDTTTLFVKVGALNKEPA